MSDAPSPTPPSTRQGDKSAEKSADKNPYKDSLNLPKTGFAMKANLIQAEPQSLKRWEDARVFNRIQVVRESAEPFVFHDGPPYANGPIHMGHMLNKVLKDFVVRGALMEGHRVRFVPGWDTHGLPIEHKVMTELHEKGKTAKLETLTPEQRHMAIRRECATAATKFIGLQAEQMRRLDELGIPYRIIPGVSAFTAAAAALGRKLTLPELLDTVSTAVWSELEKEPSGGYTVRKPYISSLRRNLQREHLDRMIDLTMPAAGSAEASKAISNLSVFRLRELARKIEQIIGEKGDKGRKLDAYSLAHLSEAKLRIEKALDATVDGIVEALVANGPAAVKACKRLVQDMAGRELTAELRSETARRIADIRASDEGREGVQAFLQRREPAWRA